MNPSDRQIANASDDESPLSEMKDSQREGDESPDHPIRQMIRRVREAQRADHTGRHPGEVERQTGQDESTCQLELDTPGSTEFSRLHSFASSLNNYSQLFDAEEIQTDLPNQIGRFRIKRILGAGGFGWVLLADDPQLNRPVALKVPRLDTLVSQSGRLRFLREARAAALLSHPNLVSVYEAGQVGPVLYIAFEWIDGQSLSQWLSEHRNELNSEATARLMNALAHAVQHAHQRGIVHRDLKPSNILIQNLENNGGNPSELAERAKIADFGLAYLAEGDGSLTRSGVLMGTPKYLAPEQIQSSGAQADPTIDVYGLGAILYELLTSQAPFTGPTLAAIVRAVEFDQPIAPRQLNPAVPRDLEAICLKCLEKIPAQRYGSAAELADDLERFAEGVPVLARRPHFLERGWRWLQRNRLVSFAFCFAILSLAIGLIIAIRQAQRAQVSLAETQHQRQRAERHRDRSEQVVDSLLKEFADSLEPVPQMQPLRRKLLEVALDHERASLADEGDDLESQLRLAESLGRIADLQYRLGEFEQSVVACEEVKVLLNQLEANQHEHRIRRVIVNSKASLLKSRILLQRQAVEEAESELRTVLAQTESSQIHELIRLRATAQSLLGISLREHGDLTNAEFNLLESIATLQSISQEEKTSGDERDIISVMSLIGGLRYEAGKYEEAVEIWKQVVARDTEADPDEPQQNILRGNRAAGLTNLAMAYAFKREFPTALEYYQQGNELYRELCLQFPLHFNHAQGRLSALTGRSVAMQNAGRIDAAILSFRESTAWGEEVLERFGDQPRVLTETGRAYGNLGNVLQFMGDEEGALEAWNKSLNLVRHNLDLHPDNGSNRADLAFALSNLANYHLQKNQLELAEEQIEVGLVEAQRALDRLPENQKVINCFRALLANQALAQCYRHNHDVGLAAIKRIVTLQPDRPDTLVFAAKTAARCQMSVAGNLHERFGGANDDLVAVRYADQALALLGVARQQGFSDFAALRQQPEFSKLVTLPEFQKLAEE